MKDLETSGRRRSGEGNEEAPMEVEVAGDYSQDTTRTMFHDY